MTSFNSVLLIEDNCAGDARMLREMFSRGEVVRY